jgi:hypothetical protein
MNSPSWQKTTTTEEGGGKGVAVIHNYNIDEIYGVSSMHYDYVVNTQNTIVDHNIATREYVERTRKIKNELVKARDRLDTEIAKLDKMIASLEDLSRDHVGATTKIAFIKPTPDVLVGDDAPAATELEQAVEQGLAGLSFDDLQKAKADQVSSNT